MKHEIGRWQVVRDCCTSGMCVDCKGKQIRPTRVVHADKYSKQYAQHVAENWKRYNATVERML